MKFLSNIKMTDNQIAEIDLIQFNDNFAEYTPNEREIVWNLEEKTFDVGLDNDIVAQMFKELFFNIKAVGAISKGDAVIFDGSVGNNILGKRGLNSSDLEGHFIMGVATEDIADEGFGKVTAFGEVRNINTLNFDDAEDQTQSILYMSNSTAGELTNIKPQAPLLKSAIAVVKRWHQATGSVLVRPDFGVRLNGLQDIEINNPQDGEVLTYDTDLGIWLNQPPSTIESVEASIVNYENTDFGGIQDNVQDAIEQLFFMLNYVDISYDGGFSSSIYNESLNVNGGDSTTPLTGVKQINGGES